MACALQQRGTDSAQCAVDRCTVYSSTSVGLVVQARLYSDRGGTRPIRAKQSTRFNVHLLAIASCLEGFVQVAHTVQHTGYPNGRPRQQRVAALSHRGLTAIGADSVLFCGDQAS